MIERAVEVLPWILSVVTLMMTFAAGNLHKSAWLLGLVAQAGWLAWIVLTESWGFLPMNIGLWIVYGRNHFKWNPKSRDAKIFDEMTEAAWAAQLHEDVASMSPGELARAKYGFSADEIRAAEREIDQHLPCTLPPPGWHCTRGKGHAGPCAAWPEGTKP